MHIGIIGMGHLGKAFISGLLKSGVEQNQLIVNARTEDTLKAIKSQYPYVTGVADKKDLVEKSDIIVIAVKPQNAADVMSELKELNLSDKTIISFMAGVTINDMKQMLQDQRGEYHIVRMMPNVGISLCKGIIGVSYENSFPEMPSVMEIFQQLGYLVYLPEEQLENITICAASGLAFAAYLMQEYQNSCDRLINNPSVSEKITMCVFEDVLEIIKSDNSSFAKLIEQISTKGGTTEAGMEVLKNSNVNEILNKSFDSAYCRVNNLK